MDTLAAALNQEPASLSSLPGVGHALDRAVRQALEKDREKRWPSTGSFAAALRDALDGVMALGDGAGDRHPVLDARATRPVEPSAAPARATPEKATPSSARTPSRKQSSWPRISSR